MKNLLPPSQRRRRRTSNASPSPVFLPDELIAEVLFFLPVKFLLRLRCVSKSWKSLISESNFIKRHLNRSAQNSDFTLVSYELGMAVVHLNENPPFITNLPHDPYYFLKETGCEFIVGSCNGLLCLLGYSSINEYKEMWLRFWNPATRTISDKLGSCHDDGLGNPLDFTFGYDNSTDTYKVVYFLQKTTNVKVFTLGDNVWRNIQNSPVAYHQRKNIMHLSGSANWLAIKNHFALSYNCKHITVEQFVIISLDLCTETHSQLLPPQGFNEVPFLIPNLSVLKDCLCFSHDFKRTHFVIWQMKEFGVEESWTKFLKIGYHFLPRDDHFNDFNYHLLPLCLSEKKNILLIRCVLNLGAGFEPCGIE